MNPYSDLASVATPEQLTLAYQASEMVGSGQAGERVGTMSLNRKARHRIHGMLADVVMLELWLCQELPDDEVQHAELEDAFSRVQARMLVVQAILWPSDDPAFDDPYDDDGAEASTGPEEPG